ncbi:geminivirus rep interacting kinase 2 [Prunus dulcis]|uniref:non-specific serine/threonine protein kinase n=1 Tax=Prunus dulcis TaxID=3755 RepID=A0A4Y1RM22_PRUDU|nr:geminivirus rep interacting kinase 2 [Prunus dulcis]
MFLKSCSLAKMMGCCSCFGFIRKPKRKTRPNYGFNNHLSQELLLDEDIEDEDDGSYNGEVTRTTHADESEPQICGNRSEEILHFREQIGMICRQVPVKETHKCIRTEDENGNKMVNEYVRECKIGAGSYGKVVLYRSLVDGQHYAIKAFHKSHLLKLRVAPSETAMTDVLREVHIMKMLHHPNIVNLIEVIDDPDIDHFYMVLEYVEGKWVCEGSGPPGGIGECTARKYLRDIVSGLMYLHAHNIVHGDIKPDNLLVSRNGTVKIGDFSVSQFSVTNNVLYWLHLQDENDELRRSPGTPVFTAPECCLGLTYRGRAADTWAVGVTLVLSGIGTIPDTYDKVQKSPSIAAENHYLCHTLSLIVNNPLVLPDDMTPQLKNLLEGLLCKDPNMRLTLEAVAEHTWVIGDDGSIPQYFMLVQAQEFARRI